MPDPANSYNLRSWRLYRLQPETPILAKDAKLIIDDVVNTIIGYKELVSGIIVPVKKGQIITHNGAEVTLKDVGPDGRIAYTDSSDPDSWLWEDPSVLGFMTALEVQEAGVAIGSRRIVNFLNTGNVTHTVTDNAGNGSIDVEASVTFPTTAVRVPVPVVASSFAAPAQNQTYYFGGIPSRPPQAAITREQQVCPVTGTIVSVFLQGTWGNTPTGNNHTFNVRINNTTDALITSTQPISGASPVFISNTGMSQAVTAGDLLAIKWQTPATWTTPVTNIIWNGMIVIEY